MGNLPSRHRSSRARSTRSSPRRRSSSTGCPTPTRCCRFPARSRWAGSPCTTRGTTASCRTPPPAIFGKSSNVGTLMLAQRIGPERYYDMLEKFGLGQRTSVGLPGESDGLVPPMDQWSGSTFSNLPIGQGLSMTLLQMTGMYQTIANDGVRDPAAHHQGHHRTRRHPDRRASARGHPGGLTGDRADRAQHAACRRPARPDGLPAGHRPGRRGRGLPDGRQDRHRPADQPRRAAATTTTSTGSPSPGWPPSTIRATSSAS